MSEPQNTPQLDPHLQARKRFFAKEMPPGYASELASILAQPLPEESERKASMLEFRIADLPLAISSRYVKAVTAPLTVCPVPHRDNTAFLGLVAFAGDIIPCVSLARILGAADTITAAEPRTIVLEERPGERWAFRVDAVLGVSTGIVHDREQRTTTQQSHLSAVWSDSLFEDDRSQLIDILRPETLFQRLQRATA